jgi:hypothetical protein
MENSYKKRGFAMFLISAFAIASIMWTVIGESQKAVAQSPMDMMNMMIGGGNMTDGTMMMGGSWGNTSLPFNMGVLAMPLMCTPNQLLGLMTGMFGGGMTGDDDNATQQMMMGLMQQQMMSMENMTELGGMENMTVAALQQAMDMVISVSDDEWRDDGKYDG